MTQCERLETIGRLARLTAKEIDALPAWAVSRLFDIQQCVDGEVPAPRIHGESTLPAKED